ncbi:MAG: nucleotidyltransferase domain-containing protein [Candidatus Heimdallarchaeota archaeon]
MTTQISKIPQELVSALKKLANEVPIEGLILFGSQAQETRHLDSDVDILAVASTFENKSPFERLARVLSIWFEKTNLEAVCIAPSELSVSLLSPLFWEIYEGGVVIKPFPLLEIVLNTFQELRRKGFLEKDENTWKFSRPDLEAAQISMKSRLVRSERK